MWPLYAAWLQTGELWLSAVQYYHFSTPVQLQLQLFMDKDGCHEQNPGSGKIYLNLSWTEKVTEDTLLKAKYIVEWIYSK